VGVEGGYVEIDHDGLRRPGLEQVEGAIQVRYRRDVEALLLELLDDDVQQMGVVLDEEDAPAEDALVIDPAHRSTPVRPARCA
jgi:hypothetical protein